MGEDIAQLPTRLSGSRVTARLLACSLRTGGNAVPAGPLCARGKGPASWQCSCHSRAQFGSPSRVALQLQPSSDPNSDRTPAPSPKSGSAVALLHEEGWAVDSEGAVE